MYCTSCLKWLWWVKRIAHFRVTLCHCFKTSPRAKLFKWNWFWFAWKRTQFYMKGFVRSLVLTQRQKATRKLPIYHRGFAAIIHYQLHVMHSVVSPMLRVSLLLVWFCQHRKDVGEVDGLTIDVDDELLYWTDVTYQNIQRADLDGGNRTTIVKGLDKPRAIVLYKNRSLRLVNSPILLQRNW